MNGQGANTWMMIGRRGPGAIQLAAACGCIALMLSVFGRIAVQAASPAANPAEKARLEFNRDIRPILSDTCFSCHGPDKNQRKAKLRLDVRENAIEKGAI